MYTDQLLYSSMMEMISIGGGVVVEQYPECEGANED